MSQRAPRATPGRPSPTAEEAKQAVIELLRAHPSTFVAQPDLNRLAELPLIETGDGTYRFGGIHLNPTEGWYRVTLGDGDHDQFEHAGVISCENGRWVASPPTVTHVYRRP